MKWAYSRVKSGSHFKARAQLYKRKPELVKRGAIKRTHLEGWCRAIPEDVKLSFKNCPDLKHLNISMSTSEIMIKGKFQGRKTFRDIIKSLVEAVKTAQDLGAETIGINAEDASRTELDRLIEFVIAAKRPGRSASDTAIPSVRTTR